MRDRQADLLIMLQHAAPLLGRQGGMSEGFGRNGRKEKEGRKKEEVKKKEKKGKEKEREKEEEEKIAAQRQ